MRETIISTSWTVACPISVPMRYSMPSHLAFLHRSDSVFTAFLSSFSFIVSLSLNARRLHVFDRLWARVSGRAPSGAEHESPSHSRCPLFFIPLLVNVLTLSRLVCAQSIAGTWCGTTCRRSASTTRRSRRPTRANCASRSTSTCSSWSRWCASTSTSYSTVQNSTVTRELL